MNDEKSPAFTLVVPQEAGGMRLDRFVAGQIGRLSRSRIQQLIRSGAATLNRKTARPRDPVRAGDHIRIVEPPPEKIETKPESIPLNILFEDDDLLVVNKPPGLVVHPGAGNREHTLVNALLSHCQTLSGIGGKERPGIVHRLDKETSGCLVVAKNDLAHHGLAKQFAARTVDKVYLALVNGTLRKGTGVIEIGIARHPVERKRMTVSTNRGREAKTEYRVMASTNHASLVECRLHSGRTHQIRVHLHHIGHPVLGDKVYAPGLAKNFPRQLLHAWKLGFSHPRNLKRMNFVAPLPGDFRISVEKAGIKFAEA